MVASTFDILARLKLNGEGFGNELNKKLAEAEKKSGGAGKVIGKNISDNIGGGLQDAASRVPVIGSALMGLSGPALGAAAAIGGIAAVIGAGIKEAETLNKALRGLDRSLAGGNRTGLSKQQLVDFTTEMEGRFGMVQAEIVESVAAMAMFDGVSGAMFTRAIKDAKALASAYDTDLRSEVEIMGNVLQNLAVGDVGGLRKAYKELGPATLAAIEDLAKLGRTAEAQEKLLKALEERAGTAGGSNAKGVSGAMFRMNQSVLGVSRDIVSRTGIYDGFAKTLGLIADRAGRAAENIRTMSAKEVVANYFPMGGAVARFMPDDRGGGGLLPDFRETQARVAAQVQAAQLKRQQQREARLPQLGQEVEASLDPAIAATLKYKAAIASLDEQFRRTGMSEDEYKKRSAAAARTRDRETEAAKQKERTSRQAFADFEAELAKLGIHKNRGRTGIRSYADQADIYRRLGPGNAAPPGTSTHEKARAIDLPVNVDWSKVMLAAQRSGVTGLDKLVHNNHTHAFWSGHGKRGEGAAAGPSFEEQAREKAKAEEATREAQEKILATMREQFEVSVDSVRIAGLRAQGLDRQAELEEAIAENTRRANEQLAQLPPEQGKVTAGLRDQLSILWNQTLAFEDMLKTHGDRETMTDAEKAAMEGVAVAVEEALDKARDMATTAADQLAIEEAILQVKLRIAGASEDGAKASAKAREAAEKWAEEDEKQRKEAIDLQREQYQDLASFYERAFRSGGKSIWEDFKDEGFRALASLAAQWTMALLSGQKASFGSMLEQMGATSNGGGGGIFASLFGGGGKAPFGAAAGASPGGGFGGGMGSMIPGMGDMQAATGGGAGGLGGFAGSVAQGMPYMAAAMAAGTLMNKVLGIKDPTGGFLGPVGALIVNSFIPAKRGSATLGFDPYGDLGVGSSRGNSGSRIEAAKGGIGSVAETLARVAEALGGSVIGAGSVSLGMRDGKWRGDPTGKGITKTKNGAIDFGEDQEAAIRWAVGEALRDGVVDGISDAAKKILASGQDLERAIEKAAMIEDIPRRLLAHLDPVGAALEDFNKSWDKQIAALREGGATAEEMAEAQKLYRIELEAVKGAAQEASAGLKDFLDDLNFGSGSPYSLRDQERMARESLQPYLDKIGSGERIDQDKYREAASSFLAIERELYGSTGKYFESMDMIRAATGKAIAEIDNAKPIRTFADPFMEKTASNTTAIAAMIDHGNERLAAIESLLGRILSGGGGGGFVGGGRGFSERAVGL